MFPAPTRTFQILQLLTCFYLSLPLLLFSPLLMFVFSFQFWFFLPLSPSWPWLLFHPQQGLSFLYCFISFAFILPLIPPFFPSLSSCLTCFPYQGIRGDIKSPAALTLFGASASLSLSPFLPSTPCLSLFSLQSLPLMRAWERTAYRVKLDVDSRWQAPYES